MPFFEYHQNNSGGRFTINAKRGISMYVIVEAPSANVANAIAEDIGLYFGGAGDCNCCGDRWYSQWIDDKGSSRPKLYSDDVEYKKEGPMVTRDQKEGESAYPGYVHYLDGRVLGFHD